MDVIRNLDWFLGKSSVANSQKVDKSWEIDKKWVGKAGRFIGLIDVMIMLTSGTIISVLAIFKFSSTEYPRLKFSTLKELLFIFYIIMMAGCYRTSVVVLTNCLLLLQKGIIHFVENHFAEIKRMIKNISGWFFSRKIPTVWHSGVLPMVFSSLG